MHCSGDGRPSGALAAHRAPPPAGERLDSLALGSDGALDLLAGERLGALAQDELVFRNPDGLPRRLSLLRKQGLFADDATLILIRRRRDRCLGGRKALPARSRPGHRQGRRGRRLRPGRRARAQALQDRRPPDLDGLAAEQAAARARIAEHQHKLRAFPGGLPAAVVAPRRSPPTRREAWCWIRHAPVERAEPLLRCADRSFRAAVPANDVVALFRGLQDRSPACTPAA